MILKGDDIAKFFFILSLSLTILGGTFWFGAYAQKNSLPPIPQLRLVYNSVMEVVAPSDRVLKTTTDRKASRYKTAIETRLQDQLAPGLVLVAGDIESRQTRITVMDRSGTVVHSWEPSWTGIWPEGEGIFPEGRRPVEGMYIHGLDILPSGDIVANFEHLSTFRLNVCGEVKWKLDNLGHHSVYFASDQTLWVASEKYIEKDPTGYPNHNAPLRSWILQNLDLDGNVLREIDVIDIFVRSDLMGLLYNSTLINGSPLVSGDTLHLNDIESFPASLRSTVFNAGDLLISLRNINAVFVIDPESLQIKFRSIGGFVRQHDPDFGPNDRITVFDNKSYPSKSSDLYSSRIVEIDATNGSTVSVLDGDGADPFYTEIMGTHQRLPNGNYLVTSSGEGRVMEFTSQGDLAWRFDNRQQGENLRVYAAMVLPPSMDKAFFKNKKKECTI